MQQQSHADYQTEYEHAVSEGKKIIADTKPTILSRKSIEEIHYWYRYAAEQLLLSGQTPKHKIVSKLYEDFDQFYGVNWIYDILKEQGISLPKEESLVNQNSISSLNTVLPENAEYDRLLARQIAVLQMARSKMSQPFVSLMDKKDYNHTIATGNGLCQMAENSFDERQLTHVPLINLFIQLAQEFTAGDAYSHYYTKAKDIIKKMTADSKIRGIRTMEAMSGKQAHETVYLKIKEIHYSLEPTDEHEARAKGFSGERCPKCKKWRTDRETDATNTGKFYFCIHCEHKFERTPISAYQKPNAVSLDFSGNTLKVNRLSSSGVTHG